MDRGLTVLTHDRLCELIKYDPETGVFTRLVGRGGQKARAGDVCGDRDGKGYLRMRVDCVRYSAHRLAWFYMTGEWPKGEVDHKNMVRTDSRWANLRLATSGQNKRNTRARSRNKIGLKGVSWHVCSRKWRSRIYLDGKERNLGLYDTPEEAHKAYAAAARRHFGEFGRAA